jgi:hypothetical protein
MASRARQLVKLEALLEQRRPRRVGASRNAGTMEVFQTELLKIKPKMQPRLPVEESRPFIVNLLERIRHSRLIRTMRDCD